MTPRRQNRPAGWAAQPTLPQLPFHQQDVVVDDQHPKASADHDVLPLRARRSTASLPKCQRIMLLKASLAVNVGGQ